MGRFIQNAMLKLIVFATTAVACVFGHGAMVSPLSRNAVDAFVGVNTQRCSNITGDKCNNGQASFWYSQGCFIGCPECDNKSGRRQIDLCGLGKKQTLADPRVSSCAGCVRPCWRFILSASWLRSWRLYQN